MSRKHVIGMFFVLLHQNLFISASDELQESNVTSLFYNRIPKTGSSTLLRLIHKLKRRNNFTYKSYNGHDPSHADETAFKKWFHEQAKPFGADSHMYFVNFTHDFPVYINTIRDPWERLQSLYYFIRQRHVEENMPFKGWKTRFGYTENEWLNLSLADCIKQHFNECQIFGSASRMVTFFCGKSEKCINGDPKWALEEAKRNIMNHYAVVGILERFEETLSVLEWKLAMFFHGIAKVHAKHSDRMNVGRNKPIPTSIDSEIGDDLLSKVKALLRYEYELYEFANQRLSDQIVEMKQEMM